VAKPTKFGELVPATAVVIFWVWIALGQGWLVGLEYSFVLLLALPLAGWTLSMRLRYDANGLSRTVGPWRKRVDLSSLESITWKMTGGGRSRGTVFVRDRHGGCVPIYVGRFTNLDEWGPLLLESAARCSATVDGSSREILSGNAETPV
jgi:hypothetical protein